MGNNDNWPLDQTLEEVKMRWHPPTSSYGDGYFWVAVEYLDIGGYPSFAGELNSSSYITNSNGTRAHSTWLEKYCFPGVDDLAQFVLCGRNQ